MTAVRAVRVGSRCMNGLLPSVSRTSRRCPRRYGVSAPTPCQVRRARSFVRSIPATVVVKSDDKEASDDPEETAAADVDGALSFAVGVSTGMTVLAGGVVSAHDGPTEPLPAIERGLRDVLHTPPSLVRQGNRVELRYDVVCQADAFGKPCALNGNVFVRSAREGGYRCASRTRGRGGARSNGGRPGGRPRTTPSSTPPAARSPSPRPAVPLRNRCGLRRTSRP